MEKGKKSSLLVLRTLGVTKSDPQKLEVKRQGIHYLQHLKNTAGLQHSPKKSVRKPRTWNDYANFEFSLLQNYIQLERFHTADKEFSRYSLKNCKSTYTVWINKFKNLSKPRIPLLQNDFMNRNYHKATTNRNLGKEVLSCPTAELNLNWKFSSKCVFL